MPTLFSNEVIEMTISKAIETIDMTHPSSYDHAQKVAWLTDLDEKAFSVLLRHQISPMPDYNGYDDDTDGDTEMLIVSPFDEIYPMYLDMKISLADRDYAYYNNAATLFNGMWQDWANYINRTYRPTVTNRVFNFKGERNVPSGE